MATLVATPGSASANSYCTLAEGDTYHDTMLYVSNWTDASDDDKTAALIWATRILDEVCMWDGQKATATQALRWPRGGVYDQDGIAFQNTIIPTWLKRATAELARHLLIKDRLQAIEDNISTLKSVKAGSVSVEFDATTRLVVFPPSVQNMVAPYSTSSVGSWQVPLVRA